MHTQHTWIKFTQHTHTHIVFTQHTCKFNFRSSTIIHDIRLITSLSGVWHTCIVFTQHMFLTQQTCALCSHDVCEHHNSWLMFTQHTWITFTQHTTHVHCVHTTHMSISFSIIYNHHDARLITSLSEGASPPEGRRSDWSNIITKYIAVCYFFWRLSGLWLVESVTASQPITL